MFNLDDYEDVAARVLRFQKAYPEGRIVTDVIQFNPEKGIVLISAQIYRNSTDTLPAAVDYAFGDASTFNSGMRKWYVEDTSSSAIGRSLSLVLETAKKPTKQNMQRVKESETTFATSKPLKEPIKDYWTTPFGEQDEFIKEVPAPSTMEAAVNTVADILGTDKNTPHCSHGAMVWKAGVTKTGKPWGHFKCSGAANGHNERCAKDQDVIWYEIKPDGSWGAQKARG
jgi:hypothetical protein